jgi:hypothetical protein
MTDSTVSAAVEGDLDEVMLRRLADHIGFSIASVYGRKGKPDLLRTLSGYNSAARFSPWIVLLDLDRDYGCASAALTVWLPQPAKQMLCRIAVRAVEAWLLADRDRIAALWQYRQSGYQTILIRLMTPNDTLLIWPGIQIVRK